MVDNGTGHKNSSLKQRLTSIEEKVNDLEKRTPAVDGKWFNFLRSALTVLSIVITLFIVIAGAFGFFGIKNILEFRAEVDNVKETSRGFQEMVVKATAQHTANIDTLEKIRASFEKTYKEMISLERSAKKGLRTTMAEINKIRTESEEASLSINRELKNLKVRVAGIDTNITHLANIFYRTALENQKSLNRRQQALLYLLATKVYQVTGVAIERPGLYFFNLASSLKGIGEYEQAIEYYQISLAIQPDLPEDKKSSTNNIIARCQELLEKHVAILSKDTRPPSNFDEEVSLNRKLILATLEVLFDQGVIEQRYVDEIEKRAAF